MKGWIASLLCIGLFLIVWSGVDGGDKKEVTIKGTAVCAKCALHQTEKCQAALKVTVDGKEVVYYVKGAEGKALHKEVCQQDKENVSITGVVSGWSTRSRKIGQGFAVLLSRS